MRSFLSLLLVSVSVAALKLTWKLRPAPDTPWKEKLSYRLQTSLRYTQCQLQGIDPSTLPLLLPPGPRIRLECLDENREKLGHVGGTILPGPAIPPLVATIQQLYDNDTTAGALQYMFVEPAHRGQGLGAETLAVWQHLQALYGCSYTLLVADDDGSGKLVAWYERQGFGRAPLLQEALGSPNEKHGVAMVGKIGEASEREFCIEWW